MKKIENFIYINIKKYIFEVDTLPNETIETLDYTFLQQQKPHKFHTKPNN